MANKLWCCGDSWAWGWAGLGPNRSPTQYVDCYGKILADSLNLQFENLSAPGYSLGNIVEVFFKQVSTQAQAGDVVLLTLPPDVRWYRATKQNKQDQMSSVLFHESNTDVENAHCLSSEMAQQNENWPYWFRYHHSLFLQTISDFCDLHNIHCVIQHNYGILDVCDWCATHNVLDTHNSMWEWMGLPRHSTMLHNNDGPSYKNLAEDERNDLVADAPLREDIEQLFDKWLVKDINGEVDWHPNKQGHRLIGEKLYELCKERMG